MSNKNKNRNGILQNLALISQVGIMMIIPIIGGDVIGAFLDRFMKTNGIFLIIFIILGVGSSFRNLYVLSIQKSKEYTNSETPSSYVNKYTKKKRDDESDEDDKS